MSSSKSLFEDVKWALSNRKLGPFKMPLKTGAKMNKYAKNAYECGRKHHNQDDMLEMLYDDLNECIK